MPVDGDRPIYNQRSGSARRAKRLSQPMGLDTGGRPARLPQIPHVTADL
jgi:hypothetical protein